MTTPDREAASPASTAPESEKTLSQKLRERGVEPRKKARFDDDEPPARPASEAVKRYDVYPRSQCEIVARDDGNYVLASDHEAALTARDAEVTELRRERDDADATTLDLASQCGKLQAELAAASARLGECEALLHDSRRKFAALYVMLATEDMSNQDLRELRDIADQGGLAIDAASQADMAEQAEGKT